MNWINKYHAVSRMNKSASCIEWRRGVMTRDDCWKICVAIKDFSLVCIFFFFLFSKMNPSKLYVTEWEFKCFTFSERIHTRKLRHWRRILFRLHAHRLLLQPDFHCTFMQFEYACAKGSTWATTIRIYYYVTTVERKKSN